MEQFRDFFFLRGGATGPDEVMESVVLDWASLVLAITSGSCSIMAPAVEDCREDNPAIIIPKIYKCLHCGCRYRVTTIFVYFRLITSTHLRKPQIRRLSCC